MSLSTNINLENSKVMDELITNYHKECNVPKFKKGDIGIFSECWDTLEYELNKSNNSFHIGRLYRFFGNHKNELRFEAEYTTIRSFGVFIKLDEDRTISEQILELKERIKL